MYHLFLGALLFIDTVNYHSWKKWVLSVGGLIVTREYCSTMRKTYTIATCTCITIFHYIPWSL